MANIVSVEGVSRANAYYVPVEQLEVKEDSRRWGDQEILDLALDILDRGQLVPIIVSWDKTDDGKERLVITDGRRRAAAIRYLNDNGLVVGEPLKVLCIQFKGAATETFAAAAVTNLQRKGLSPIDLAHTISTLEKQGKSRKEIAKVLGISESLITQSLKLLTLPVAIQKDIHKGKLAASVGYEMAGEPQSAATAAAGASAGSETGAASNTSPSGGSTPKKRGRPAKTTVESVREGKRQRAEKGEAVAGPVARSRKVIYNELSEFATCDDGTIEDDYKKIFSTLVRYMDGKVGIRAVLNQLRDLSDEG